MNITFRKITVNDLEVFIKMRINQLREEGAKEDINLEAALKDYYLRHLSDGTFISWLALDNDRIIGTSGMSIVEKPPYFGCPSGKIGLLSKSDCCQVCLPIRTIEEKVSQKHCFPR